MFSKLFDTCLQDVEMVLSTLQKAAVLLTLGSCCFSTDTVKYLGHTILPGALTIDETPTKSINQLQHPQNLTKLRIFLGFCSLLRRLVSSYTNIAAPLTTLLQKWYPKNW